MSKEVRINFILNNQNFKKILQCSKKDVEDGELVTVFDIEEFKKQIKKIDFSGDIVDYDELCKMITESFNVRIYKRAYIIECEAEIEVEEIELKEEIKTEEIKENIKTELKEVKNDAIFENCFDYMIEIESHIKKESQKQADRFQDFYAENGEQCMVFYDKIFQKELSILALLRQELFCIKSFMKSI